MFPEFSEGLKSLVIIGLLKEKHYHPNIPIIICLVLNCILLLYPAHVWPSNKRRTDICRIKYTNQPATLQIRPTSSTKIR